MPDITINASDGGKFQAYLAMPKSGKGPGMLVIQEIFGVNKVMRDLTDGFAAQGYVAICPDLFWRQKPGIQITDQSKAEWDQAFKLFTGFDQAKGIEDLKATLAALRKNPACSGKVGAVGYCLGGRLTYMMAAKSDVDASVSYYGVGLEGLLDDAPNIRKPLMLHIAEQDGFVPREAQDKIKAGLKNHAQVTIHSYPGVDHAFARNPGVTYNKEACDLANKRTAEFFGKHLG